MMTQNVYVCVEAARLLSWKRDMQPMCCCRVACAPSACMGVWVSLISDLGLEDA